jgi:hypothetical protein
VQRAVLRTKETEQHDSSYCYDLSCHGTLNPNPLCPRIWQDGRPPVYRQTSSYNPKCTIARLLVQHDCSCARTVLEELRQPLRTNSRSQLLFAGCLSQRKNLRSNSRALPASLEAQHVNRPLPVETMHPQFSMSVRPPSNSPLVKGGGPRISMI